MKTLNLFLLLILLSTLTSPCGAQQSSSKAKGEGEVVKFCRQSVIANSQFCSKGEFLKGLSSVALVVEDFAPELKEIVDVQDVRTALELRCRSLGLKMTDDRSGPILYVNIEATGSRNDVVAYHISVEYADTVFISPDLKYSTLGKVWDKSSIFLAVRNRLTSAGIKEPAFSLVDEFLNDWMRANGK